MGIQSLEIALDILQYLAENGSAISLTNLSAKTGIQPSKLHRYLVSFTRRRLLTQSAITGLYDLGPLACRLGVAALNRFDAMGYVHQAATVLCAKTGYTIALYVWTELGPALVRFEPGSHRFPVLLRIGSTLPLYSSATGRVFLAWMPSASTKGLLDREREAARADGRKFPSSRDIEKELAAIRSDCIYWTPNAIIPGLAVVAPVFDPNGEIVCAVCALGPLGHANPRQRAQVIDEMRKSIAHLSETMFGQEFATSTSKPRRLK
jgi:DNA-binding IclR family transcriptional regulator